MTQPIVPKVEWRDIPNMEGYAATVDGQILSRWSRGRASKLTPHFQRYLTPRPTPQGYMVVSVFSNPWMVHQLVLLAFVGPRPIGYDACHNNGTCTDNRLSNLRWDTRSANIKNSFRHGNLCFQGERNNQAKLTAAQVREVRAAYAAGETQRQIAQKFGLHQSTVSLIVRHVRWRNI